MNVVTFVLQKIDFTFKYESVSKIFIQNVDFMLHCVIDVIIFIFKIY